MLCISRISIPTSSNTSGVVVVVDVVVDVDGVGVVENGEEEEDDVVGLPKPTLS